MSRNGRDLTSEDIRYAIDRYAHYEKSVHQGFWSWLDSIETPDKTTVILKAKFPYADAVQVSGGGAGDALGGYISPKEWAETDGAATKMVGSGPFINTEYQTDVYAEQRGLEQMLYDRYPEAQFENGGFNKIRGISPSNPNLPTYMRSAWDFLERMGS